MWMLCYLSVSVISDCVFFVHVCMCVCVCCTQAATSVDVKKVVLLQNELETSQRELKAAREVGVRSVVVVGSKCEPMHYSFT